MKKTCGLITVLMVVIIIIFLPFLLSRNLVKNVNEFNIHKVEYNGKDVTELLDLELIKAYLQEVKVKRTMSVMNSYEKKFFVLEIDAVNEGVPLHILLGNTYICYESVGSPVWKLIGGDILLGEIIKDLSK